MRIKEQRHLPQYTKHRKGAWDTLDYISETYNVVKGQTSPEQSVEIMKIQPLLVWQEQP